MSCRIAVLVSGNGSNLEAILEAVEAGDIRGEVGLVVSNVADAYALTRAANHSVKAAFLDKDSFATRAEYDRALAELLAAERIDLVVLAGYMLLVGKPMLDAFAGRIMNLHPALLPSFPGEHGAADALAYGVKVTGVTVHFVDEGLDTGPIVMQEAVPVLESDTVDSLMERIHEVEHRLYPRAVAYFCLGKLRLDGRRVYIET